MPVPPMLEPSWPRRLKGWNRRTWARPPGRLYLIALDSRFSTIWLKGVGSPSMRPSVGSGGWISTRTSAASATRRSVTSCSTQLQSSSPSSSIITLEASASNGVPSALHGDDSRGVARSLAARDELV